MNWRALNVGVVLASCLLSPLIASAQTVKSHQLEVHIRYTGTEKVMAGHKFYVLVLDAPKNKAPFAITAADIKTRVARFENLQRSPVFVAVYFDPHSEGEPDFGKPPRLGSIVNVYGSIQAPKPVELAPGKTTIVAVTLDDSGTVKGIAKERTAKLAAVNDPLLAGSLPVYYTSGYVNRAQRLQSLLGGELAFYESRFGLSLDPIVLAVLDAPQWRAVVGEGPYGMPSVDQYGVPSEDRSVFVMPAHWEDVTWMPFPQEHDTPAPLLKKAFATGKSWRTLLNEGADGIGTHEIGHTIVPQLRIYPPMQWLNELLASYLGYAYLSEMRPDEVIANQLFWRAGLTGSHSYTSLSDFEQHPELPSSDPVNYGWYQCAFDQRVTEVYRYSGLDFIRRLQQAFPLDGSELDTEATLNKLEALSPGWKLWADEQKSGKVNAVQ